MVRGSNMQKDEATVKTMSEEKEESTRMSNEEEDDEEMGSFIRIRSQTDGIFEQEDEDDEDDEFYDFPIPEVEMRSPPTRKRKQDISFLDNELTDVIELPDDEEQMYTDNEPVYALDSDMFHSRKRDRLPLYLLNPDDYGHDPKKQIQIRRAIITYRHHQDKKEQIIKLTEENKKLREYTALLKAKVVELSRCGCNKNQTANLEVLDIVIPQVPPRMYVRGNRPVLAVPYNKCPMSPTSFAKSSAEACKNEGDSGPKLSRPCSSSSVQSLSSPSLSRPTTVDPSKPLINITSSRLASLNCKAPSNLTPIFPKPPVSKPYNNGMPTASSLVRATRSATATAQKGLPMGSNMNRVSISGMAPNRQGFIPISLAAAVKNEPGLSSTSIMSMNSAKVSSSISTPSLMNANVKIETSTPATSSSASRIVFAKKGNTTNAVQTASQLLFGTRAIPQGPSPGMRPTFEASAPLTASQLAFANRIPKPSTITNPLGPLNNTTRLPSQSNQVFRTASGQVLKLVPTPPQMTRKMPSAGRGSVQRFHPIVPKPTPALKPIDPMDAEAITRQINKQQMEEMWRSFEDDEEDELAIIAAINGTSPPQRTRKQTMGNLTKLPEERPKRKSNGILKAFGEEIELNKYEDIVFEEAD